MIPPPNQEKHNFFEKKITFHFASIIQYLNEISTAGKNGSNQPIAASISACHKPEKSLS
jgi:hypothetical protein